MRVLDLSVPISVRQREMSGRPTGAPDIEYIDHKRSAAVFKNIFGCTDQDLPIEGHGWAVEDIFLTSHCGTHMDAPWHYGPLSEGKIAPKIDEIPLEWCFGDGVVLDFRTKERNATIEVEDVQERLQKINYTIKPLDIVCICVGWDQYWGTAQYFNGFPGMTRAATLWLAEKGVKIMGTDGPGFDRDFATIAEQFHKTRNSQLIWEAHFAGITRGYYQIEKMANLHMLPAFGFKICCFPVNIEKASAAWVRPVALLD
jgi:kynurenine formamidase